MKLKHVLFATLLSLLMVSCDGSVLVEVVTAENTPNKNYQKILGVESGTVYYQNRKGLFSNSSSSTQGDDASSKLLNGENTLIANKNGALVLFSCLYDKNILYFLRSGDSTTAYRDSIGCYNVLNNTNDFISLRIDGISPTSQGYLIKGLHEDGGLVVYDESSKQVFLCYPKSVTSSAVTFQALPESAIDVQNSGTTQFDVGTYFMQRTKDVSYSMMTCVHNPRSESGDDYDYEADLFFFEWNSSGVPTLLAKTTSSHSDCPANFVINKDKNAAYVLCTNGKLYKYALDSSTARFIGKEKSGHVYGTGCLMYYVNEGGKDYFITKPNYKSRAIIVLQCSEDATGNNFISSDDLRKGYAQRLDSDLVNCFYELRTDSTSKKSYLLVGSNESGMVSITINWPYLTSNGSSNGSSSYYEQYDTNL